LPASAGGDEQRNQRRVRADPVQRHLDRDDVWILNRRAQERLDRSERLERMVHEHVLIANPVEDRLRILVCAPQRARLEGRILQLGTVDARQLRPVTKAKTVRRPQHHVVGDLEVLDEDVENARRDVGFDVQQRDGAPPQLLQAAVHALEQVVGFVFLDLEVGVADDAEQVRALDLRAGEELVDVGADHVLEEHETQGAGRGERLGQRDESRQRVGHLDACELGAAPVADHHREVLAQVRDERERMTRVERQRRQHRADLAREVAGQMLTNFRRPVLAFNERDLLGGEELPQLAPNRGLILEHLPGALTHRVQLLLGVVAVWRNVLDLFTDLLQRRRDADHEELVEIRTGDREELHSLEQGM
jgi:hypothetical protein